MLLHAKHRGTTYGRLLVQVQEADIGQVPVWYSWPDFGKLTLWSYFQWYGPHRLKSGPKVRERGKLPSDCNHLLPESVEWRRTVFGFICGPMLTQNSL